MTQKKSTILSPESTYIRIDGQLWGQPSPTPPSTLPFTESSTTSNTPHVVIVPLVLGHDEKDLRLKFAMEHLEDVKRKEKSKPPSPPTAHDHSAKLLYTLKRMEQGRKSQSWDPDPIHDHERNLANNLNKIDQQFAQSLISPAKHALYRHNAKQKAKIIDMINAGIPIRTGPRIHYSESSQALASINLHDKQELHVVKYVKDKAVPGKDRRIQIVPPNKKTKEREWKDFEPPIDYAGSSTNTVYYKAGPTVYRLPKSRLKKKMRPRRLAQPLSMIYSSPFSISHRSQGTGFSHAYPGNVAVKQVQDKERNSHVPIPADMSMN